MRVAVPQAITRPPVGQPSAISAASEEHLKWNIGHFLSTSDAKQLEFLSKVYIPGRTATNQEKDATLLREYQKNLYSFHQNLYAKAAILETTFQHATQDTTKLFFIHAVCDAAHTYTYDPNAGPRLQNLANRLLDTQLKLFETNDSYIPKSKFLSDGKSFRSSYIRNAKGIYEISHYGAHFGNLLFRLTPDTGELCFSPLFIHYLSKNLSKVAKVDAEAYRYEDLATDAHFNTSGAGFKTLTDRDAVAHYRWLTENASGEKFTAYLASIGDQTDATSYSLEARKTLLADLSKQYWHLGHGSISHASAAVVGTQFQGAAVPLNLVPTHLAGGQGLELSGSPYNLDYATQSGSVQTRIELNESDSSSENPHLAMWLRGASTSSIDSSTDSKNDAMQPLRDKRRTKSSVSSPTRFRPLARPAKGSHQPVSSYPHALLGQPSPLSAASLIKANPEQLRWGLDLKNEGASSDEEGSLFQWSSDDGALVAVGYRSAANRPRALFPLASTSSSDSNTDSENDAMQPQTHRYKRRPNPSVSRPTPLEDARSLSHGEYQPLLATSSRDASSGSENSANRVGYYGSFSRHSRKVPHRNSRAGHLQRPADVHPHLQWNMHGHPDIHTRQDQRATAGLWKSFQDAAPSESRKRKSEQPPMESTFRYIAPSYVERITYMEPEKIIRPLYYIPVIQKQQKDRAYKIRSFFKKLFFAIRMR
jgi:hypothetical protein